MSQGDESKQSALPAERRNLSVAAAAAEIGCSVDHVWQLIRSRELDVIRVPGAGRRAGRVLVPRRGLEKALRSWMRSRRRRGRS